MVKLKSEKYKGFTLKFQREEGGIDVIIRKYKYKNTEKEQYISETIETNKKTKKEAFADAKNEIDRVTRTAYKWRSICMYVKK